MISLSKHFDLIKLQDQGITMSTCISRRSFYISIINVLNQIILCCHCPVCKRMFSSIPGLSPPSISTLLTPKYVSCCLVAQSYPTLCDAMDRSTPGFPVLHYHPKFTQTYVRWVNDAIQSSHPLSPPRHWQMSPREQTCPWLRNVYIYPQNYYHTSKCENNSLISLSIKSDFKVVW